MKKLITRALMAILLAFTLLFGGSLLTPSTSSNLLLEHAYADEETETTPVDDPEPESETEATDDNTPKSPDNPENPDDADDSDNPEDPKANGGPGTLEETNSCREQTGSLSWLICPGASVISKAVDGIYGAISKMLIVAPLSFEEDSPIYVIWQYARDLTNIVFVIFILVVILSQLTGIGLNNYGIKRVLPRIIIAVILVNLSFLICAIGVDASNILGYNLQGFFDGIQQHVLDNATISPEIANISMGDLLQVVLSGGVIGGVVISALGGGGYIFFMLLTILIGALVAVIAGLITISARHAVIALLIMISPLAFVAYLLPNTEKWFTKWKDLLFRMLIFFPAFSFLFGASQLVGWVLISSATESFGLILGIAVQIFPLFFSWSLMKMSGTVLGRLNEGVRKVAAPMQRGLSGWSLSHAENRRQNYIGQNNSAGAHLRRYLDGRRELRDLDTKNAIEIRHGQATEYAFKTASSNRGLDQNGNMVWDEHANRYTRTAKRASTYGTRARTAQSSYATTLASYGNKFATNPTDTEINAAGTFAGSNSMAQQYLAANQAEADQKELLDLYLKSYNDKGSYQFNRLYANAAGALGHTGQSSIIGQVIRASSEIEMRRRRDADIIDHKFIINKRGYRAMTLDKASTNDDGYELDENGFVIEDDNFDLLPGKVHREWPDYIAEHKVTKKIISKEQYNSLSSGERANYTKVRYLDVTDDNGNAVATIYEDDAGYMKELLRDTINIGDPINARYATTIGVAHADDDQTGILRRYHSTISTALNDSKYKEHNAAYTAMLTQHLNNGYVTTVPQYYIAALQSLNAAAKAGQINVSDAYAINMWNKQLCSLDEELFRQKFPDVVTVDANGNQITAFEHYFPDKEILNYLDINGLELPGLRLTTDNNGNQFWEKLKPSEVNRLSRDEQLDLRKNFLKHDILADTANKLIDSTYRGMSPKILEEQKLPTRNALLSIIETIGELNNQNFDQSIPFDQRLKANTNLLDVKNPSNAFTELINFYKKAVADDEAASRPGDADSTDTPSTHPGIDKVINRKVQADAINDGKDYRNDHQHILEYINDLTTGGAGYDSVAQSVIDKFDETESLVDLRKACRDIIEQHRFNQEPTSHEEAEYINANFDQLETERIDTMIQEIYELVDLYHHYDPEDN